MRSTQPTVDDGVEFPRPGPGENWVVGAVIVNERGRFGIRIGESFVTDAAIADNVFEGVLVVTPENIPGATCGSSAPALLGQPGALPAD